MTAVVCFIYTANGKSNIKAIQIQTVITVKQQTEATEQEYMTL